MAGEAKPLTAEREVEIRAWLEPQAGWVTQQQWLALAPVIVIDLLAEIDRLRSDCDAAREALASAIRVAGEAREEWDKAPSGMRAGKILIALSGHCPRYRADIDAIHAVLNTPAAGAEGGRDGG